MSQKKKILIISTIVGCVIYILFSQGSLAIGLSNNGDAVNNTHTKSKSDNSSIFSLNFLDPKRSKAKLQSKSNLVHRNESINQIISDNKIVDKKPSSFSINFDGNVVGNNIFPGIGNNESANGNNGMNLVVDDTLYMINNPPNFESANGFGETIFVTDDVANSLISCTENLGSYKCHTAVSNLNNPQDILVINNRLYIIDSHPYKESGDITKCNINNAGYIDSCGQERIDMVNPVFFYYNPPNVHISTFVYSGGSTKPDQAMQCTIDNKTGDFINCIADHDTISMYYISKNYNNTYYRPYSDTTPTAIEKCATVDATYCPQMLNKMLAYPLSLSINHDRIFISNSTFNSSGSNILKCTMDMKTCSVVTNEITSPMCIGVFNFSNTSNTN